MAASLELATALGGARPHAGRSSVLVWWLFAVHEGQWSVWPQPESIHWAQTGLPTQCHPVWHLHWWVASPSADHGSSCWGADPAPEAHRPCVCWWHLSLGWQPSTPASSHWCLGWLLCHITHEISVAKTKVMVVSRSLARSPSPAAVVFTCNGLLVQHVDTFKYLGLHFHTSGDISHLITPLKAKAAGSWAVVQQRHSQLQCGSTVNLKLFLLQGILVPSLHYGCELWGMHTPRGAAQRARVALQSIYDRYLRHICGVKYATPSAMLLEELGLSPLQVFLWRRTLEFWNKIAASPVGSLFHTILIVRSGVSEILQHALQLLAWRLREALVVHLMQILSLACLFVISVIWSWRAIWAPIIMFFAINSLMWSREWPRDCLRLIEVMYARTPFTQFLVSRAAKSTAITCLRVKARTKKDSKMTWKEYRMSWTTLVCN